MHRSCPFQHTAHIAAHPPTALQAITVLHCLQRLSSAPECMDTLLALPNIAPRLWKVYSCGQEAVAFEVAKLFLRWWSPHTSRRGTGACVCVCVCVHICEYVLMCERVSVCTCLCTCDCAIMFMNDLSYELMGSPGWVQHVWCYRGTHTCTVILALMLRCSALDSFPTRLIYAYLCCLKQPPHLLTLCPSVLPPHLCDICNCIALVSLPTCPIDAHLYCPPTCVTSAIAVLWTASPPAQLNLTCTAPPLA